MACCLCSETCCLSPLGSVSAGRTAEEFSNRDDETTYCNSSSSSRRHMRLDDFSVFLFPPSRLSYDLYNGTAAQQLASALSRRVQDDCTLRRTTVPAVKRSDRRVQGQSTTQWSLHIVPSWSCCLAALGSTPPPNRSRVLLGIQYRVWSCLIPVEGDSFGRVSSAGFAESMRPAILLPRRLFRRVSLPTCHSISAAVTLYEPATRAWYQQSV